MEGEARVQRGRLVYGGEDSSTRGRLVLGLYQMLLGMSRMARTQYAQNMQIYEHIYVHIDIYFFSGGFFRIFKYFIQHCFICRPSYSTVPEDAGIEPRTVATWHWLSYALTSRLDLIGMIYRYIAIYVCLYVCMYVCVENVSERRKSEKTRERKYTGRI